jgi:hypothetical protein
MGTDQAEALRLKRRRQKCQRQKPRSSGFVDPPLAEAPKAEPPKAEMPKAEPPKAAPPAEDFPSEAPAPVEKTDDMIVGEIKAVSKTGKGIKIDDLGTTSPPRRRSPSNPRGARW